MMSDYDYERWFAELDADLTPEDYFARLRWEMQCCYRAIDRMRKLAEATSDTELMQDAQVLEHTVRARVVLDDKRLHGLPPIRVSDITPEAYRQAWKQSRTGSQKDIARKLDVNVSTIRRFEKANPTEKLPRKTAR